MISAASTDYRVGRGTPLGEALRRYWTPACLSSDIQTPDCDPYRVRLLGDSLVAFRDSAGRVGLLDEACPHRKASLVFGRNEGGGLRCLWHHWKFTVDGEVLETPNVNDCTYKDRIKAKSYPVRESGGIVWAYLGPPEHQPPFPEFSWADAPADRLAIIPVDLDCSFLYPLEGLLDSAHVALLHTDTVRALQESPSADAAALQQNAAPDIQVEATDFGFHYVATRDIELNGERVVQARITAYAAPYLVFIASGNIHLSVPQDDTHTRFYNVVHASDELSRWSSMEAIMETLDLDAAKLEKGGITSHMPPMGPLGHRNEIYQDREGMRAGRTFSGLAGLTVEDAAMTVSAGYAPADAKELLVPADVAIVRMRRWMSEIARAHANGEPMPATRPETLPREISGRSGVLKPGGRWQDLVPAHRPIETSRRTAGV